jgi:hypothetical protein
MLGSGKVLQFIRGEIIFMSILISRKISRGQRGQTQKRGPIFRKKNLRGEGETHEGEAYT